jgi:hypothetical protein
VGPQLSGPPRDPDYRGPDYRGTTVYPELLKGKVHPRTGHDGPEGGVEV